MTNKIFMCNFEGTRFLQEKETHSTGECREEFLKETRLTYSIGVLEETRSTKVEEYSYLVENNANLLELSTIKGNSTHIFNSCFRGNSLN